MSKLHNVAWLDPSPWLRRKYRSADVAAALSSDSPGTDDIAALLSPAADAYMEQMAKRALALTRRHFGRTISLYAPLYLSNYCTSGCAYCGYASDRNIPRKRLSPARMRKEMESLKRMGLEDVLLLTGERSPEFGFEDLLSAVKMAADIFPLVSIEAFPMTTDEYRSLSTAGCTGVTLYQETYDPSRYKSLHRWGPKKDYVARLSAPERALEAGMRVAGLGFLIGLTDPLHDAICLQLHASRLLKNFWKSGITISFPRLCNETGLFKPPHRVDDRLLARMIFAFRICFPDVPLVLSTRESPEFRDGMAGIGISRMSVASKTTVGGYARKKGNEQGQFTVNDDRDVKSFCRMLKKKKLEPVFKNWDAAYR